MAGIGGSAGSPQHAGRTAALLVVLLAVIQLALLALGDEKAAWVQVVVGAACVVSVPVAVALWRDRGFECRACAVLLALGSITTRVLAMTVGAPGRTSTGWTPESAVVLALAAGILLLVGQETLLRLRADRDTRPYA